MLSYEAIILIVNITTLTLAILDYKENYDEGLRDALGGVIVYANLVFSITAILFLVTKVVVGVWNGYKMAKKSEDDNCIRIFLRMIIIPF